MKKRFLPLVLALVLCLGLTVPALAEEATIEEAIPCQFDIGGPFHDGLAVVGSTSTGKFGYINKSGELVIPYTFDGVNDFSEGFAKVEVKGQYGFINKTGTVVVPCGEYDEVQDFSEGLAAVAKNDKWGYIDTAGKLVIPCEFESVSRFSNGIASGLQNNEFVIIDKTGKATVFGDKYTSMTSFREGFLAVAANDKWGFVDQTGKEVVSPKYDDISGFSEGFAMVYRNNKWGFIDTAGKEAIPCTYADGQSFHEGVALVNQNNKWGYIDTTGKTVIDFKYEDAWEFSNGFAPVQLNGKWGYIDKTGKEIVPCKYDDAGSFSDGMALVKQGEKYGYLSIVTSQEPAPSTEVSAKISNWAKELVDGAAASGLIADGLGDDYTRSITRAQFAAVSVKLYEAMSGEKAPAAGDSPFTDTSDPAVIQAEALGFVGGVGNGKFEPDSLVTREQAATMLSRVYTKLGGEIPAVDATDFADNDAMSGYARSAIAFMSGKEIVGGVGDNKFNPKGNASIEQALVIALRMFEKLK